MGIDKDRIRNWFLFSGKKRRQLVGIDTMLFIYQFEKNNRFSTFSSILFDLVETAKIRGVTSILTLLEVLAGAKKAGDERMANEYRFILTFFPNLEMIEVKPDVAEKAADLRARYSFRTPDAIQLATSIVSGADAFISNDEKLIPVKELEVLILKTANI